MQEQLDDFYIDNLDDDENILEQSNDNSLDSQWLELIKNLPIKDELSKLDDIELIHDVGIGKKENLGVTRKSEVTGKDVANYVDNEAFCQAIVKYNRAVLLAAEQGLPKPKQPDSIGVVLIQITEGVAARHNFRNYTYIDEMKLDGQLAAVKAVKNFNPEKSSNGFGYFTLVIWRAFLTRIKLEKLMHETKMSMIEDPTFLFFDGEDNGSVTKNQAIDFMNQGH